VILHVQLRASPINVFHSIVAIKSPPHSKYLMNRYLIKDTYELTQYSRNAVQQIQLDNGTDYNLLDLDIHHLNIAIVCYSNKCLTQIELFTCRKLLFHTFTIDIIHLSNVAKRWSLTLTDCIDIVVISWSNCIISRIK
jgi:hypothetical protein